MKRRKRRKKMMKKRRVKKERRKYRSDTQMQISKNDKNPRVLLKNK
jgi:hypothetical protein